MARLVVRIFRLGEEEKGDDSSPDGPASFFFVAPRPHDRSHGTVPDPPDNVRVDIKRQVQTSDGRITP